MRGIVTVNYNGVAVAFEGKEAVNLTDLWRAAGSPDNKSPYEWSRLPQTKDFLNEVSAGLNTGFSRISNTPTERILKTTRGNSGGTWAPQIVAVSYAGYLSPKLQIWVNQVFLERLQELVNPDLAYSRGRQRAIEGWKRQGKSEEWIGKRIKSMDNNLEHRQVLADHGVDKMGFVMCANNINCGILGTTGKKYKEKNGFPVDAELRNCMDESQIVAGMLSEILSDKKIIKDNINGNKPCAKTCYNIAKEISTVVNRVVN